MARQDQKAGSGKAPGPASWFVLAAQCRLSIPMIRWAMPPDLAPMAPVVFGVRPEVFIPRPRTVPPVPFLPATRPAAFLIMLPKFM
jgi:hypothetical protein